MQVHGGEPLIPLLQAALGINCDVYLISSLLKTTKKKWKRNLLLKEAQESPKSAAFFLYKLSPSFMWCYVVLSTSLSSAIPMVSLSACSIHRRRKAYLFEFLCLIVLVFWFEMILYLLCATALVWEFLSLTSCIILQTAFKEGCGCLWGDTVGWERKG